MSLSDRINDKFEQWRQDVTRGVAGLLVTIVGKGIELVLDIMGKAMKPALMPTIDKLLATPDLPPEVKTILTELKTKDGQWQSALLGGLGVSTVGGASSAAFGPIFRLINSQIEKKVHSQVFDYPIILSAWLRGEALPWDIFEDLNMFGYSEARVELLKKLVWLRLDPRTIQQIWPRDKGKYESLWKDLHDIGWDDERIAVYKELALIPPNFARWAEKIGLTGEWAKNYWAAHWALPSAGQGFEMLHRGVITYEELKVLLRALDVMPYWREKLIEIAYSPYTRVDVRRMYKVAVLDEAGVKKAYMDLGYNEERAQALTEFTLKTYARPEDAVEDEEEKIRDLTRADICDGYRRGIFTAAEAGDLLSKLAYTPESIQYYLDREDLKKDQALKDAYATNYRQLFVIGLKDADTVKSEMVALGFLDGEVDEYLRLWYIEKLRRQAKPSRTDLARFLKKGIITEVTWHQSMADLGYADKYIDWYRSDIEE